VLDEIDRRIISLLQHDGRITMRDLAAAVHLSPNAAAERYRKLVASGVVTRVAAVVSPAALGRPIRAFVDVRLGPATSAERFEAQLAALPQIEHAAHVTGTYDLVLQVACRDTADLDALLTVLKRDAGAVETNTRVMLREITNVALAP
jgi:Lrp/AsnC family transcriptional regulator, leucine-responsive regulatory protein